MLVSLLKWLLGEKNPSSPTPPPPPSVVLPPLQPSPPKLTKNQNLTDQYFTKLIELQAAIADRKYDHAAALTRDSIKLIPALVKSELREYGRFVIQGIPALEQGGTMLALQGDIEGLLEMQRLVRSVQELKPWIATVDQHIVDQKTLVALVSAITEHPGCLQTDMKGLIGAEDARRLAVLLSWLEKAGTITRSKQGKTYSLRLASSTDVTPKPSKRVASHRTDNRLSRIREVRVEELPYVPLPRAPSAWEETHKPKVSSGDTHEPFVLPCNSSWTIASITKLPMIERPDPAFRQLHFIDTGLLMVDDLAKSERAKSAPAAVLRYGRFGTLDAEGPLLHDIYRFGVNPFGHGFIAMSKDCVAHAYNDSLHPILETSLREAPEVRALQGRSGWGTEQLKNLLRCVALSFDNSRYLFTGLDEAACVDIDGKSLWRVRLPLKEGWEQVSGPGQVVSTDKEVLQALQVMKLELPVTPDDIKRRYRELAKQYHPDLHPGDPHAEELMKALTAAAEKLTGINSSFLVGYTGATFSKPLSRESIEVPGAGSVTLTINMGGGLATAADWIYAANFCGQSHGAFLAGYSGKIVRVDELGEPIRVYDIGAVPRRIIDTGDYLYFLTDTRLYILRGEALHGIVDVFDSGDLLVTQNGFGLLENTRLRWFSEDGIFLNEVMTRNPIRRVYSSPAGMVLETREHRAVIAGLAKWWENG
jgi:hypothetical protein